MKTLTKISAGLNLALLAALGIAGHALREKPAPLMPSAAKSTESFPPIQAGASSVPPAAPPEQAPSFRWSDLMAADYATFVKNLRACGCPEKTIQAIVAADVDDLYQSRVRDLKQNLAGSGQDSWQEKVKALQARPAWQAELAEIETEKRRAIAGYLAAGAVSAAAPAAAQPPAPDQTGSALARVTPEMPLVFKEVDASRMALSDEQARAIDQLRNDFVEAVGGPDQDPNDPAYRRRWVAAQIQADAQLKAQLGLLGWEQYQVATWQP